MTKRLRPVRNKPYRVRKIGERGLVVTIPGNFADVHGILPGQEFMAYEDEDGRLVLDFHGPAGR